MHEYLTSENGWFEKNKNIKKREYVWTWKKWDPGNGKERIRNKPCSTRSIKKSKKINRRWMNFKEIISI